MGFLVLLVCFLAVCLGASDGQAQQTKFFLFTRSNQANSEELTLSKPSRSNFNGKRKTFLLIHGFLSDTESGWVGSMRRELLKKGDFNVIKVDWGWGAKVGLTNYNKASSNTRKAAEHIANMVNSLKGRGLKLSNVHCIGHSLGAHTCGFSAKRAGKFGRITGMDPAGPNFNGKGNNDRLSKNDASWVEVIHTNGGSGLPYLGMYEAIGHADFYPNGGRSQPGCFNRKVRGDIDKNWVSCSHSRVHDFYIESINSRCGFTGYPCTESDYKAGKCSSCKSGCNSMGYRGGKRSGKFFLDVNSKRPYCKN